MFVFLFTDLRRFLRETNDILLFILRIILGVFGSGGVGDCIMFVFG